MICQNCGFDNGSLKQRSSPENRYLHGVILPILSEMEAFGGWSKDEIKEFLKEKFLSITKTMKIGDECREVKVVPSSARLSTVVWEKWMSDIRMWARKPIEEGGLNCQLPEPNEQRHPVLV